MADSNDASRVVLSVAERFGIWGVTLNGRFYGDYVKKQWAKEAALEKARRLSLAGKCAQVELTDDQGNVTVLAQE